MQLRFTFFYFGTFKLGLEITWQLRFVFARYCDGILLCRNDVVLRRHNYIIYLLDVVIFFHNVRITLYFGTFELRMEITLQLRFVFARHCDVFLLRHSHAIYLFVVVTFFDDVRITSYFSTFELRTEITLWIGHFLVTFVCNQKMTKKYVNYFC